MTLLVYGCTDGTTHMCPAAAASNIRPHLALLVCSCVEKFQSGGAEEAAAATSADDAPKAPSTTTAAVAGRGRGRWGDANDRAAYLTARAAQLAAEREMRERLRAEARAERVRGPWCALGLLGYGSPYCAGRNRVTAR